MGSGRPLLRRSFRGRYGTSQSIWGARASRPQFSASRRKLSHVEPAHNSVSSPTLQTHRRDAGGSDRDGRAPLPQVNRSVSPLPCSFQGKPGGVLVSKFGKHRTKLDIPAGFFAFHAITVSILCQLLGIPAAPMPLRAVASIIRAAPSAVPAAQERVFVSRLEFRCRRMPIGVRGLSTFWCGMDSGVHRMTNGTGRPAIGVHRMTKGIDRRAIGVHRMTKCMDRRAIGVRGSVERVVGTIKSVAGMKRIPMRQRSRASCRFTSG